MDKQKNDQPQQTLPVESRVSSETLPVASHSRKKLVILGLVGAIVLLAIGVGVFVYSLQNKPKTPILAKVSPTAQPTLADPTADWESYALPTVGLTFKLPPQLSSLGEWKETKEEGETGSVLCFHIPPDATGFIPKAYAGGIGICSWSDEIPFTIGGSSTDFSAGREGTFTDYQGFEEENGKYYALFVKGSVKNEIPSHLVTPISNPHGVEIIKVKGENLDNPESPFPQAGSPGEGNIGAHINTNNLTYRGLSVFLKLNSGVTEEEFDQILSTFRFTQ